MGCGGCYPLMYSLMLFQGGHWVTLVSLSLSTASLTWLDSSIPNRQLQYPFWFWIDLCSLSDKFIFHLFYLDSYIYLLLYDLPHLQTNKTYQYFLTKLLGMVSWIIITSLKLLNLYLQWQFYTSNGTHSLLLILWNYNSAEMENLRVSILYLCFSCSVNKVISWGENSHYDSSLLKLP